MKVFYLALFVIILGTVEVYKFPTIADYLTKPGLAGLLYDDLHGIGALVSSNRAITDDILSDSVEFSQNFVDKASDLVTNTNLGAKIAYATRPLYKTDVGKKLAENVAKLTGKALKFATKLIPYASEVLDIADGLLEMFKDDKELDKELEVLRKALEQTHQAIQEHNLFQINNFMTSVKQNTKNLNETISCMRDEYEKQFPHQNAIRVPIELIDELKKKCNKVGVGGLTSAMFLDFQNIGNGFAARNSAFRKYPLLAAPVFIELSLLVSIFEPMAIELIPGVADGTTKLSCLYRDALIDDLPFVLEARFQKVNATLTNMIKVRNEPYNPIGYNKSYYLECEKGCVHDNCLIDQFADEKLYKLSDGNDCDIGYLQHLRHLVEKLFPIDVLNKTCNRGWEKPTGNSSTSGKNVSFKCLMDKCFFRRFLVGQQSN